MVSTGLVSSSESSLTLPTMPTTSRTTSGENVSVKCFPIGSSLGQKRRASASDQRSPRTSGSVGITEVAPPNHRNMHGVQIPRANQSHVYLRLLRHRHYRTALDQEGLVRSALTTQRQRVDYAGRLHTRQSAGTLQDILEKINLPGRRRELIARQRDMHSQHIRRIEARLHAAQLPQRAHH